MSGAMLNSELELTILMPCLNEAETLGVCIDKAMGFLARSGIAGEVVVADNGSTDGSIEIARACGARVVPVPVRGYGAALWGGAQAARGRFVIMADADDSYDLSDLMPFVLALRGGADLVMGNRFKGGIAEGAMPPLHRWLGNPVLSWIGRLFFEVRIGDFHCGLRGYVRDRLLALGLQTTGMEFASEMVVRAALARYDIREVPTTLAKDGRSRAPHLRTWRDGWRHLAFLLMYSPRWLFLYPGAMALIVGLLLSTILSHGLVSIGSISLDIHSFLVSSFTVVIAVEAISFALVARRFAGRHGFIPRSERFDHVLEWLTLERVVLPAAVVAMAGALTVGWCVFTWAVKGFGPLEYEAQLHDLVLGLTAVAVGLQVMLLAFLASIMDIPRQAPPPDESPTPEAPRRPATARPRTRIRAARTRTSVRESSDA
jgi:glycosyltransferase involved in cell wall biosynthesis